MKTLATSLIITFFILPAYAVKPISVKNDRVLLDLEGEKLEAGDKLGARDTEGKARALLEIKQVKQGKAVAAIVKGKMQLEYSIQKITPSGKPGSAKAEGKSKSAWGFTAGYAMTNMTIKPTSNSSITLSGSSFNASGFYQMPLEGRVSARILGGYETLQAKGTSASATCTGSTDCSVDISYLGVEALVRYSFVKNKTLEAWVGAGLGFLFAMNKSSNVLDTAKITTNQTIVGTLGLDYNLSRDNFIPIQLDYAIFPDNNTSSANQIILRAGYGFNF